MYIITPVKMKPGSTIEGMIRFHNHLDMSKEQIQKLVIEFNKLNPDAMPPKPYQEVDMPILVEYANLEKQHHINSIGE